ncbi:enterochelin esterase [Planomonospora sp. ID91781]|uniref:enterochelin esterase n=1 Tax=Planomonospora sp. ID91781 TaxID=2738135 RepID=UPI0018C36A40|nr:enterochelin esterase [Planomonospora sp. ID91781]MBG0821468.1 enterochelin esterase [Planomonospora sp. ID91781]
MRNVPPQLPCPCPPEVLTGRRVTALAADLRAGRTGALEAFWAEAAARGTPLVEEIPGDPGHRAVTFLWRGDAEDVLVMANKLTDPGLLGASLMERIDGTDVWHRTYRIRSGWRGSYRLAPRVPGTVGRPLDGEAARRRDAMLAAGSPAPRAAIERWCLGLTQAVADPLNPRTLDGHSVAELPGAPSQRWLAPRPHRSGPEHRTARPERRTVGGRTVWRLRPDRRPEGTLVLLDGECWLDDLPVLLGNLTEAGAVPPLAALLVEAGPPAARIRDLTCDDDFVAFLADELPSGVHPPARTAVAGQSLGGLTALYAAHRRPDRFGAAIAQSGSFWWPNEPAGPGERSGSGGERLTAELAAADRVPDRVYVEVGTYEWALLGPTRRLRDTLRAGGCELTYREYEGGHDHACWRGSLADGLIAVFS